LRGRLKLYRVHSKCAGCFHVGREIVGEEAFPSSASGVGHGVLEDFGRRLHGADFVREHRVVEMPHQRIIRLDHFEVDRIGVREDHQAMALGQAGKKRLSNEGFGEENTGPKIAKFMVGNAQVEHRGKFFDELFGADLSAFEAPYQIGPAHPGRDFGSGVIAERLEPRIGELEIKGDDDVAEVK